MSNRIEDLYPELQDICRHFIELCASQGLKVGIAQTFRSKAEQEALYAQGRTKPGSIVTNAKYPRSAHCWGLAFDIYRNDGTGAYNESGQWFERCGAIGKGLGLAWGGDFRSIKDRPHFEFKRLLPNNSCNQLIKQYGTPDRFMATWKEADEDMTQEQFYRMFEAAMTQYNTQLRAKPESAWSAAEGAWTKAQEMIGTNGKPIVDGTAPQASITREQFVAVLGRLGLLDDSHE